MKYKVLGDTGLRVSEVCLGTMTFGKKVGFGEDIETCRDVFETFVAAGGNFIDTSNVYSRGDSELMLRELMGDRRKEFVIASKYSSAMRDNDLNSGGNHRKNQIESVNASLERLGTDYLDYYFLHIWDPFTPIAEVMRALDDLVTAGKILHVGISNAPAWLVGYANGLAESQNWTKFSAVQVQYSLVQREIENDIVPLAQYQNLYVLAHTPLAGGLLSGKYSGENEGKSKENTRFGTNYWGSGIFGSPPFTNAAEKVKDVAKQIGCTPAQLALQWLISRPSNRIIPILGARNAQQLRENLGSLEIEINEEQESILSDIMRPPLNTISMIYQGNDYKSKIFGEHHRSVVNLPRYFN